MKLIFLILLLLLFCSNHSLTDIRRWNNFFITSIGHYEVASTLMRRCAQRQSNSQTASDSDVTSKWLWYVVSLICGTGSNSACQWCTFTWMISRLSKINYDKAIHRIFICKRVKILPGNRWWLTFKNLNDLNHVTWLFKQDQCKIHYYLEYLHIHL